MDGWRGIEEREKGREETETREGEKRKGWGRKRKQRMQKLHCGRMEGSKGGQSVCIFTMQN